MDALLAFAATLVSLRLAAELWRRHRAAPAPELVAWTGSLAAFALGSGALAWGAAAGWDDRAFRVYYLFGGLLTAALLAWSLRRLARPDPVQLAWRAFCRKLASHGLERAPHEGPRGYSTRAARALPASRRAILRIGALYIRLRYGASTGDGRNAMRRAVQELRRLVRELRIA